MSRISGTCRRLGVFAFVAGLFCSASTVHAQDLQITPMGWDFGDVVVGTSRAVTFDFTSLGETEVWVYRLVLAESMDPASPYADPSPSPRHYAPDPTIYYDPPVYTLGAFSFDAADFPPWPDGGPVFPQAIPAGEHVVFDMIFAPSSPGYYSAYLRIESDDVYPPPGPVAHLLLEGTGVCGSIPAPGALLLTALGTCGVGWLRRRCRA